MDFSSFVRHSEKDVFPETPHLSISLRAPIELSLIRTLPYPIHFTIRRMAKGDGADSRPCIFRFDPSLDAFSPPSALILLRHRWSDGGGGLEAVPVNHGHGADGHSAGQQELQDSGQFLWELAAPGDEVSLTATLPERYYRAMGDDWHTFALLYPGTESLLWDWGTMQERVGWELKGARKLVVPGGARVNFATSHFSEYRTADPPWFKPPPPVEPSDRVPGAPYFTVTITGPTLVKSYERLHVALSFTYHGVTGTHGSLQDSPAPSVTFHSWVLTQSQDFAVHVQRRRGCSDWEDSQIQEDYVCGWDIYDEPDVKVYVGQRSDDFTSLNAGESWSTTVPLNERPDIYLPRDSMPGDVFRYRVKRSEVDWWDWGTMEEHRETAVMLPCFIKAKVTDPKDNGGRPRLMVPASEWFEFTLIE